MTTSKAGNAVAVPRAFILDCDGVLTDPVVKCVTRLDVFTALGERLDRGEVVTINTGRSIAWLIRNGILDFVERAVHNKANLERFMVVCEKGASWVTFIGGVIRTNIDKAITVPDAVREDIYDLVQDHFLDCMFWDPTKLTMISVEMIDGMPVEAFHKRQADLVVELQAILNLPEHRPLALEIDASTIATDIQHRLAGKHLGARRIVEWLERRGLAPEHFVTVGDSQSDTAMAEELQDAHAVDFVYVGDPARFNADSLRCRVVQTNARFELGTLEYLEKPSVTAVTLVERYNPQWATWFLELHALLGRTLAGHFYGIEHVGSTSVPGMTAKPIIDIDIVMREGQFERIKSYLAPLGYEHVGDLGITGREAFKLSGPLEATLPPHHLYAVDRDADELRRHLAFRDYLRTHPEWRERLSEHKWQLAERLDNDKEAYIEAKAAMVQEIVALALAEQGAPA